MAPTVKAEFFWIDDTALATNRMDAISRIAMVIAIVTITFDAVAGAHRIIVVLTLL